ncbi:MAG: F0F1 ATP synthase subunit B [Nitrospiria bacterium]
MFEAEPGLIIWTWITFGALVALLAKVAYKPIVALLESRETAIREEIEASEKKRKDAEEVLEKYQSQLSEGRVEVQKMIEEGRTAGEKLRREIMEKAAEESKALVSKAQEEISREKQKALMDLQEHVAKLSVSIAAKMIATTLKAEDHGKLIEGALSQVKEAYGKTG